MENLPARNRPGSWNDEKADGYDLFGKLRRHCITREQLKIIFFSIQTNLILIALVLFQVWVRIQFLLRYGEINIRRLISQRAEYLRAKSPTPQVIEAMVFKGQFHAAFMYDRVEYLLLV